MTNQTQEATIKNGMNVTQFEQTVEAIKADPAMAQFKFRVNNKWNDGGHNTARVQNFYGAHQEIAHENAHVIEADEPAILCGTDKGANPVETLLAALSGCMTTTLIYKSAAQGYNIESVESSYEGDIDLNGLLELKPIDTGYQEIRVKFKVKGDTPLDEIKRLVETSPVFDTLRRPIQLKVDIEKE